MTKKKSNLRYIYKINSSRLRRSKWSLNLTIEEAIKNDELISLSESTVLRFIQKTNNKDKNIFLQDTYEIINNKRKEINKIKKQKTSIENRNKIKQLYKELHDLLFIKEYVCIIIDNNNDYDKLNRKKKSFYINGIKFKRFLATTGGQKKSTIIYVKDDIHEELFKKINNGRNLNKPVIPAKLESYMSLACSSSEPVSYPKGVLVVKDCETEFLSNIIKIDDTKSTYPIMTNEKDYPVRLNDSDGYGLILPKQSYKWCKELGDDYIPSGFCVRNSYCKGMLFSFDFIGFADQIAKKYEVIDAWGNTQDIRNVQVILTTSMLKLWDSYNSIEHYLSCCKENDYTFSVTKMIPKELENERNLNYQFIQSLYITDEDIDKLINPTVKEIHDVLGEDYIKSILFLKGIHVDKDSFYKNDNDFIKALMIEKEMINDPFVKNKIHNMIKKRINEAKVGVIKVKGNFSIVSGDPYSLCQSIFGLKVTGLLRSGEFYSNYWNNLSVDKVACFRAPMTCHNNIRILRLKNTEDMNYWYKFMDRCTIFNSWDTTAHALNGLDKDADAVMTTNNPIIISAIRELDAIMCVQKNAEKKIPTEEDFIRSNKNSFGDEIGFTTNTITNMFDVMANFKKDTKEYEELNYRIMCGQNYQQNAIDKAKGIVSKPMPKEWYNYMDNIIKDTDSEEEKERKKFNISILADKKPYFFSYIYPKIKNTYDRYIKNTNSNALMRFGISMENLINKPDKTSEEENFVEYYYKRMPVSISNSVMNKICWKVEKEFNNVKFDMQQYDFDYSILTNKQGYTKGRYNAIKKLYASYVEKTQEYSQISKANRIEKEERTLMRNIFKEDFKQKAYDLCNDANELCNIVIDLCYKNNHSKQFAWDISGDIIIQNLLEKNNYNVTYPIRNSKGTIDFGGEKFSVFTKKIDCEEFYEADFE